MLQDMDGFRGKRMTPNIKVGGQRGDVKKVDILQRDPDTAAKYRTEERRCHAPWYGLMHRFPGFLQKRSLAEVLI